MNHVVGFWVGAAIAAFAFYVLISVVHQFTRETGTVSQRIMRTAYDSGTVLWTKLCAVAAGVVSQIDNLCDLAGADQFKDFLHEWIGDPKTLSAIILGITTVTFYARMRRGSADPIQKS